MSAGPDIQYKPPFKGEADFGYECGERVPVTGDGSKIVQASESLQEHYVEILKLGLLDIVNGPPEQAHTKAVVLAKWMELFDSLGDAARQLDLPRSTLYHAEAAMLARVREGTAFFPIKPT